MNLLAYRVNTAHALFPPDLPQGEVVARDPDRMLFIGDSAASGYGVLNHGLAVVSQTARYVAREHNTGCSWTTIADTEMTMSRAVSELKKASPDVDVAVIILGPPDVLLGTTATEWSSRLRQIVTLLRQGRDPDCRVVVSAIPPMYRFQPMPLFVQRLLALQIHRLNRGSIEVAESLPGVSYSPFPSFEVFADLDHGRLKWRTVHSHWGKKLGAITALALSTRHDAENNPPHSDQ